MIATVTPGQLDRAGLRVVVLSSLGGALEFYDFVIYGVFSAYLSKAFFPSDDPLLSLLGLYGALAAGYLARPIGGLVFGGRGDRRGRRGSFMLSLGLMSAGTAAMGLLPTFGDVGPSATVAFVALRLLQGFCVGGELPGAITYAVEVVPARRVTLACGLVFGCVSAGVLLATGVSAAEHAFLSAPTVDAYGWRIAFVLGGLLGGVSWTLRRTLEESPAFERMRARTALMGGNRPRPVAELFSRYPARIVVGICATGLVGMFNGLLFAHTPAFMGRVLHYPPPEIATGLNLCVAVTSVVLVIGAAIGDLVPRRWVYRLGCVVIGTAALPFYQALVGHDLPTSTLLVLWGLATFATHGIFAAILADLFPTEVRFSGVGFSINIGAAVFSGLAPLAAASLIEATGRLDAPAFLIVGAAVIAFVASFWLRGLEGQIVASEDVAVPSDRLAAAD